VSFPGHTPGSRAYRRLILGLFFAGIATFAQLYAPQAVLPLLARDLAVDPATAALSVSAATLGLAASVIGWSVVADRIGRVPAMAVGVIAATALGLLAPFAGDIGMLLALRCAEGIALGAVPAVALAYLCGMTTAFVLAKVFVFGETSNTTESLRQARCSSTVPARYDSGISQPPNGTIFAPSPRWTPSRGLCSNSLITWRDEPKLRSTRH